MFELFRSFTGLFLNPEPPNRFLKVACEFLWNFNGRSLIYPMSMKSNMKPPFNNSYWLIPDQIVCGEYPRDVDDLEDHEGMTALLGAGVRTFVDLTEPDELKPYRQIAINTAEKLGINPDDLEFNKHPIRDVSVPRSPAEMTAVLETIQTAVENDSIVYLHCWGGRGRTGTVAGCLLTELHQVSGTEALVELKELWKECAKSSYAESPETEEQREFVRDWNR